MDSQPTFPQTVSQTTTQTLVLGADPAGLTAAYQLSKSGESVGVIAPDDCVGGYARSESHSGYRFTLTDGSCSTKNSAVEDVWKALAGEFERVERRSHIYYRDRLFTYPLSATNALKHLGPIDATLTSFSYLKAWLDTQLDLDRTAKTAEDWLIERFGAHLYRIFFESYFEKVWGVSANQLTAECAARSVRDGALPGAAIRSLSDQSVLVECDHTPGLGSVWENCQQQIENTGSTVELETDIVRIEHNQQRITKVVARQYQGEIEYSLENVISSLSLADFIRRLDPPAPEAVQMAVDRLRDRSLIVVPLLVEAPSLPEHCLYIHSPEVAVSRIQNYKKTATKASNDCTTCLGLSYFCDEGDPVWQLGDDVLIERAIRELVALRLVVDSSSCKSATGGVMRQRRACPIQTTDADKALAILQSYLSKFENLQRVGRSAQHRYQQQNDCLLDGLVAAETILTQAYGMTTAVSMIKKIKQPINIF